MSAPDGIQVCTAPSIIVIGLVPAENFGRFLRALRERYPEARLTAVVGAAELQTVAAQEADECLPWGAIPPRALVEELRRRRPRLVAVPYNPEYAATRTYWKALALATLSRSKGVLFCKHARLPERNISLRRLGCPTAHLAALAHAVLRVPALRALHLLQDLAFLLVSLPLGLILLGIMGVDLVNGVAGLVTRRERKRARPW